MGINCLVALHREAWRNEYTGSFWSFSGAFSFLCSGPPQNRGPPSPPPPPRRPLGAGPGRRPLSVGYRDLLILSNHSDHHDSHLKAHHRIKGQVMEKGCCTLNSTEQASSWPRHGLPAAAAGGGGPGGRGPEAAITGNMRQCQSGTVLFKYRYGVSESFPAASSTDSP